MVKYSCLPKNVYNKLLHNLNVYTSTDLINSTFIGNEETLIWTDSSNTYLNIFMEMFIEKVQCTKYCFYQDG